MPGKRVKERRRKLKEARRAKKATDLKVEEVVLLPEESLEKVAELIENPPEPTKALKELMKAPSKKTTKKASK